ncbi:MotA/TolQ/ExbB proton channel family protein [Sphingomonas bacterium]|uniref:MotA/TolQ/ExbB proton channel family protein n=1 Tax=Sphingomonas bacterium TaxID=1895847 RepID=UPI0020C5E2CC|nr:MotA/TolQ/ExbB proton channel family protein [Sphingomonas bacterium]
MGLVGQYLTFLDPLALLLVLGGSSLVACARVSRGEAAAALAALGPLVRADPEADADAARRAVSRIAAIAEVKGIVFAERIATTGRFLAQAVAELADARDAESFARWANETLDTRARRHAGAISFWETIADTAPAMGMIATVLGLVRMFAALEDPRAIGAPMATALIATLLGLILANLVAGPIASRLERLSIAELAWQRHTLDHLTRLARAELTHAHGLQRRVQRSVAA